MWKSWQLHGEPWNLQCRGWQMRPVSMQSWQRLSIRNKMSRRQNVQILFRFAQRLNQFRICSCIKMLQHSLASHQRIVTAMMTIIWSASMESVSCRKSATWTPSVQQDIFVTKVFVHPWNASTTRIAHQGQGATSLRNFAEVSAIKRLVLKMIFNSIRILDMHCFVQDDCLAAEDCQDNRCVVGSGEHCRHHIHCPQAEICQKNM